MNTNNNSQQKFAKQSQKPSNNNLSFQEKLNQQKMVKRQDTKLKIQVNNYNNNIYLYIIKFNKGLTNPLKQQFSQPKPNGPQPDPKISKNPKSHQKRQLKTK